MVELCAVLTWRTFLNRKLSQSHFLSHSRLTPTQNPNLSARFSPRFNSQDSFELIFTAAIFSNSKSYLSIFFLLTELLRSDKLTYSLPKPCSKLQHTAACLSACLSVCLSVCLPACLHYSPHSILFFCTKSYKILPIAPLHNFPKGLYFLPHKTHLFPLMKNLKLSRNIEMFVALAKRSSRFVQLWIFKLKTFTKSGLSINVSGWTLRRAS
jgi:hypothetical protein